MKNTLKISALSVALLAAVMVINTNANNTTQMNLQITAGSSACSVNDTWVAIADFAASYNTGTTSWSFTPGALHCEDTAGSGTWYVQIQAGTLTSAASKTIDASNVEAKVSASRVVNGDCTKTDAGNIFSQINSPYEILAKTDATAICDLEADLDIQVTVPGSTPVGLYQGNLTFTSVGIDMTP